MKTSGIFAGIAATLVGAQVVTHAVRSKDVALIRPPGFQGEQDFMSRCVKCGKCAEACPYVSIRIAKDDAALAAGTPYIDARAHACRMCEDFPCVKACPTGALRNCETRDDIHMGTAVIDETLCIALKGLRCEVCYRSCPLIDRAITLDYRMRENDAIHSVFAPVVNRDICTGCGVCVERCVVSEPRVAINIVRDTEKVDEALANQGVVR